MVHTYEMKWIIPLLRTQTVITKYSKDRIEQRLEPNNVEFPLVLQNAIRRGHSYIGYGGVAI